MRTSIVILFHCDVMVSSVNGHLNMDIHIQVHIQNYIEENKYYTDDYYMIIP